MLFRNRTRTLRCWRCCRRLEPELCTSTCIELTCCFERISVRPVFQLLVRGAGITTAYAHPRLRASTDENPLDNFTSLSALPATLSPHWHQLLFDPAIARCATAPFTYRSSRTWLSTNPHCALPYYSVTLGTFQKRSFLITRIENYSTIQFHTISLFRCQMILFLYWIDHNYKSFSF